MAIPDVDLRQFREGLDFGSCERFIGDPETSRLFLKRFESWRKATSLFQITGLEDFQAVPAAGVTEAFSDFVFRYSERRLRVLRGEYPFHRDLLQSLGRSISFFNVGELDASDCVILSVPFSGNGEVHPDTAAILHECESKRIPVFIDAAFAFVAQIESLDIRAFQCVRVVAFSLSKSFDIGRYRAGVRYSRDTGGNLALLHQWDYVNKVGLFVADRMMESFGPEWIYRRYREPQVALCRRLGLVPSSTVLFGIGDAAWDEYRRDGLFNRVCLSREL